MENEKNTAQEILQEELAAIYIGNLNTVDEDLILPGAGKEGMPLHLGIRGGEIYRVERKGTSSPARNGKPQGHSYCNR